MVDFDGKLVGQDTIPVDGMGKDPVIHQPAFHGSCQGFAGTFPPEK